MTREQRVEPIKERSEQRPPRRRQDPPDADGAIGLAKDLRPTNNPTISEHTVNDSHKVVVAQSVPIRVKRFAGNVLEGEAALPVPALKPPNFKAAVWALAIEKDFELPIRHLLLSSYGG